MQLKLEKLKAAAARDDWSTALRIAARFPRLGAGKAAILRAHSCLNGGGSRFYGQLGYAADDVIADGIAALKADYKLDGR